MKDTDKIVKLRYELDFAEKCREELKDILRSVVGLQNIAQQLKDSIKLIDQGSDDQKQKLLTEEADVCEWKVS